MIAEANGCNNLDRHNTQYKGRKNMKNSLPHVVVPKEWKLTYNTEWKDYEITEGEIQKYPWLKNLKSVVERYKWHILVHKDDKTRLHVFQECGDETEFDIRTGKVVNFSLGD